MLKPERYTTYFADLSSTVSSEIRKIRPVVVISEDAMNEYSDAVVVWASTSRRMVLLAFS